MHRKTWTLCCAALLAGTFGFAAEQATLPAGEEYSLEFAKDKMFIRHAATPRLLIGRLFFTWTPQIATPVSVEVLEDNTWRIDYAVSVPEDPQAEPEKLAEARAALESIKLTAHCSAADNRVKITYLLNSPLVRPDGMMQEILAQNGTAKQDSFVETICKLRPFGGKVYQAKGRTYRPFAGETEVIWLKLPGNPAWCNGWAEHLGFQPTGNEGEYRAELDFLIAPPELSGNDVSAVFRNEPLSMTFADGKLVIRNLGYKTLRDAELSLGDSEQTLSLKPGESVEIPFEETVDAAILSVGEKNYAAARETTTE